MEREGRQQLELENELDQIDEILRNERYKATGKLQAIADVIYGPEEEDEEDYDYGEPEE